MEEFEQGSASQNDLFLKIVKFFVLSPVEKTYITKIEAEIQESLRLD